MSTVILARTYADASEVAMRSGLGHDWIYPHKAEVLQGMRIQRVIYVEGWLHSSAITTEVAEMVQRQLVPDGVALIAPRDITTGKPQAAVSAPFVETTTQEALDDAAVRRRRPPAPAVLMLAVAFGGGLVGAVVVTLGRSWGWWA